MSQQFTQAAQEGIYLRFPDSIPPQRELSYENAIHMLLRAAVMAQNTPFAWAYIDKPQDGAIFLLCYPQNLPFAIDGIRFIDQENKFPIPAGARELEVCESKYGFIPGPNSPDTTASRVRRRYRLTKGGNHQLMLVHYTRGPQTHIPPALMNQPVRTLPPRPINEPPMYVAGDKVGQKVYPTGGGAGGPPLGPGPMPGTNPMQAAGPPGMVGGGMGGMGAPGMGGGPAGMGGAMTFAQQQALLAQQNSSMDALEQRRRERERQAAQQGAPVPGVTGGAPRVEPRAVPQRAVIDEPESDDEVDQISSRTLAMARYKRNHDWMNEVFMQAAFGKRVFPPKPSPYSIFNPSDVQAKTDKLQAEIEELQARAARRRAEQIRNQQGAGEPASADTTMQEAVTV